MREFSVSSFSQAIAEWRRIVGPSFVDTAPDELDAAQTATYATENRVLAILRPANRDQVQACVRAANRFGLPLYPISTGKNWGYGSRVPTSDNSVILDLGRLNRIVEFDEQLAYVVVEPGVTQRHLFDYLQEHTQGRLWLDATSSSAACSLIGNMVERGHGVSVYCDHVACAANYEVVLPTGDLISTGYGAFAGASASHVDNWGLGPSLTGLFSQSNLGIVTKATIWLMRAPEQVLVGFFTIDSDDAFEQLLDDVRPLRLDRILKSGPFLGNIYQGIQKVMRFPWEMTGGAVPLPLDLALRSGKPHRYGRWNGSVALYGTSEEVAVQRERLSRIFSRTTSWSIFVDKQLHDFERSFPATRHAEVRSVVAGFCGGVGATGLPAARWRIRGAGTDPNAADLDRAGCGMKFWTATTPFRGANAREVVTLAESIVLRHGFEPAIGIFPVRERALQFHISCAYDRGVPGCDEAVAACHEELGTRLMDLGHMPTRLGVGTMAALERSAAPYRTLIRSLKCAIDPKGVMAPGRYEPSASDRRSTNA